MVESSFGGSWKEVSCGRGIRKRGREDEWSELLAGFTEACQNAEVSVDKFTADSHQS